MSAAVTGQNRPNILFVVSDEERRNDWLDGVVDLPAHERLRRDGTSFDRHYTHASPCSPSRASLYTGTYLWEHGVVNNVSFPSHIPLDPTVLTVGQRLKDRGYRSAYLGKWHLSHGGDPDLASHGYDDWQGNDKHFTGNAWTGRFFDPIITDQALDWLQQHGTGDTPWFLTVALVNPHDIMWYPIDHLSRQSGKDRETFAFIQDFVLGGEVPVEPPPEDYPERFGKLPANFNDDLSTKPEIHRRWQQVRNTEHFVGSIDQADHQTWLRGLDYYAWLHEQLDLSLQRLLGQLDDLNIYDDTMIVYTSDHGDACGSHGLRAKLPCVYEEVVGVPLIIKPAAGSGDHTMVGRPGQRTRSLSSSVDVAATIAAAAGADSEGMSGVDLAPVLTNPTASVREAVLFGQDSAQSDALADVRYALRGFFDGTTKYARYFGVGGGIRRDGRVSEDPKSVPADALFGDQEHEWYEVQTDPAELENRAFNSSGSEQQQLTELFTRQLRFEQSGGVH